MFNFFKKENKRKFEKISALTWSKASPEHANGLDWANMYLRLEKPKRATRKSAGYDFFAPFGFTLEPGEVMLIPTGIKSYMNDNDVLLVFPRSSLGFKYRMVIVNTVGIIDADYVDNPKNEGHIFIKIENRGDLSMTISAGEAFCQGMFFNYLLTCDDNTKEERVGGIGSTSAKK